MVLSVYAHGGFPLEGIIEGKYIPATLINPLIGYNNLKSAGR